MAATALVVHTLGRSSVDTTATAASNATDGNTIPNDGKVWLEVNNTDASSATLTLHFNKTVDGQAVTSRTYSVAAAAKGKLGPFPVADYGTSVLVTTANALLQLAAFKLGT